VRGDNRVPHAHIPAMAKNPENPKKPGKTPKSRTPNSRAPSS